MAKNVDFYPNFGIFCQLFAFFCTSVSLRFFLAAFTGLLWISKSYYYVGQIFGHVTPDFEIKVCLANFATICNFAHNFGRKWGFYAKLCFFWNQNILLKLEIYFLSFILLNSNSWVAPLQCIKNCLMLADPKLLLFTCQLLI